MIASTGGFECKSLHLAAAAVVVATQTGITRYFVVATGNAVCVDMNPDGGISNDTCR